MSDNRLRILVVRSGEPPRTVNICGGLPAIREIIGGETEELCPFADTVSIVRNRRGDELRLNVNCLLKNGSGQPVDVIRGTFAVVGVCDSGYASLTDEQVLRYLDVFSRNRVSHTEPQIDSSHKVERGAVPGGMRRGRPLTAVEPQKCHGDRSVAGTDGSIFPLRQAATPPLRQPPSNRPVCP